MSTLITIYQSSGLLRAIVDPDNQSEQSCGVMRGDIVKLSFTSALPLNFAIGDYFTIFGNTYQLNLLSGFTKSGVGNFQYSLVFEGDQYDLTKTAYLFLNQYNQFTEAKFTLLGRPLDFVILVVANLNRLYPGAGWSVGAVDNGDYQSLSFDGQNCMQVLSTLASTFLTEYIFEGKKISLIIKQPATGVTLEYGKGKALYSITQQNQDTSGATNMVTRLYAYGSNRNLGSNYRNGAAYLRLSASGYIEKNTATLGVFEKTVYFDGQQLKPEIYPNRVGVVTAVTSPFIFTDAPIDFNVNAQLIPGVTAQLTFNTGLLTGYTFDIAAFDNITKTFTINANTSNQTVVVPSVTLTPAVGDQYVITNIIMPQTYIKKAEARLAVAAKLYLQNNGFPKISYPVGCNPIYFKNNNLQLQLGHTYTLLSTDMGINRQIRVVSYTRNLRNPFLYKPDLAEQVIPQSALIKLINSI